MTVADDLKAVLKADIDNSGDVSLRVAFGQEGYRIEWFNGVEDTGQSWTVPGFMDSLMNAIGSVISAREPTAYTISQIDASITYNPNASWLDLKVTDGGANLALSVDVPSSGQGLIDVRLIANFIITAGSGNVYTKLLINDQLVSSTQIAAVSIGSLNLSGIVSGLSAGSYIIKAQINAESGISLALPVDTDNLVKLSALVY